MSRILHFLDNRLTDAGKVVRITHQPHTTPLGGKKNSVALVRERTLLTKRTPLVSEVSARKVFFSVSDIRFF
jgi:hypothetical protein